MARHQLHHRFTLLDGVLRLTETSSNDVTKLLYEIDVKTATEEQKALIMVGANSAPVGDDEAKQKALGIMAMLLDNADALLYYACDITVKGWYDVPQPPDEPIAMPDPDPTGGIELPASPVAPELVHAGAPR